MTGRIIVKPEAGALKAAETWGILNEGNGRNSIPLHITPASLLSEKDLKFKKHSYLQSTIEKKKR